MADTTRNAHADLDAVSGQTTTGHSWDGIKELNTPLPRWWLWTFYLTILWSIGYWIIYPAWPLISSHTRGVLGYSSPISSRSATIRHFSGSRSRAARRHSATIAPAATALAAWGATPFPT